MPEFREETVGEDEHTYFLFCSAHYLLWLLLAADTSIKEITKKKKKKKTKLTDIEKSFGGTKKSRDICQIY